MKSKHLLALGLVVLSLFALTPVVLASSAEAEPAATLVEAVRKATSGFQDVEAAEAAGYGLFHGCVSGPQRGAMGLHCVNGDLVGDGEVDAAHPEALLYEAKGGKLRQVGVEYVVIAEAWDAKHATPPMLRGQLFNYVGSPNRYGLPAFYELHVWAWQNNPDGMFADFNPHVSCEEYAGEAVVHEAHN
jgi:hypothetical protein